MASFIAVTQVSTLFYGEGDRPSEDHKTVHIRASRIRAMEQVQVYACGKPIGKATRLDLGKDESMLVLETPDEIVALVDRK